MSLAEGTATAKVLRQETPVCGVEAEEVVEIGVRWSQQGFGLRLSRRREALRGL